MSSSAANVSRVSNSAGGASRERSSSSRASDDAGPAPRGRGSADMGHPLSVTLTTGWFEPGEQVPAGDEDAPPAADEPEFARPAGFREAGERDVEGE